ncbi:hypothetical protein EJ04DRAFT_521802 [Polyplosphaeria fusca]|uniref:glucan endo-1,3-beta-D-glucosidase n=1 Tax=Polyplosphaeria fusca TaxID=682080 RepID=A0A9P4R3Z6_9PLEO|nr:hypothetical protein EJ04DRAFT_521802 [Polyplosphaeria fusca]
MWTLLAIAALPLLAPVAHGKTSAQLCRGTAAEADDGNWYCSEVSTITYKNISQPGTYNRTTGVDPSTGLCAHQPISYSGRGSLTPLLGELSMHLRGPMNISKIAIYTLSASASNVESERSDILPERSQRTGRQAQAAPLGQLLSRRRAQPSTTSRPSHYSASIEANPQHFNTRWFKKSDSGICSTQLQPVTITETVYLPETACECIASTANENTTILATDPYSTGCPTSSEPTVSLAISRPTVAARAVGWNRIASYTSAAPAEATGIVFLANLGDERKSGTFDYAFGNSLSYVSPDGGRVASDPGPFAGTLQTSEVEMAAFSDKACNGDCEYSRPKSTQYHGWDGESKAFFIEFQMDHYDNVGNDQGMLSDAPAWWFLNAAIPRTLQYGNDRNNIPCSCWSTGCGEFDAFEVLGKGEERAKSTIHRQGNLEGGDSNYFQRPVGRRMKFGVIFTNLNITATVIDDSFNFPPTLDQGTIDKLIAYDSNSNAHSLFRIGS